MSQQLSNKLGVSLKLAASLAGLAGIGIGASKSIYNVDGGHRAIIFSRFGGVKSAIYSEGWHFRIPLIQYPRIFDIRAKPRQITSVTGSKDLQMVNLKLRILTRPDPFKLPLIYCMLGQDYEERVLPSICLEVLNAVVAKFDASQLITKRHEVSLLVRDQLIERAKSFNIIFEDVSITDLSFGRQYTAAIEAKQVAQQEAQRASFEVEKAKQEKQRKILQAEGEAKAAMMLNEAISKNPGYLRLRKIQAARQVAKVMSQSQNTVYLDSASLMLNIADKDFDITNASLQR